MTAGAHHPYFGRRVVLASMHGKEAAIAAPFMTALGLELITAPGIDTDLLGTFSGEIERIGSMLDVAERKARVGMAAAGCDLGLASEGSFGPHPQMPFLPAGRELLTFVDEGRALCISEALITETNYACASARETSELQEFLIRIGFPSHAVVVSPQRASRTLLAGAPLFKGVKDLGALTRAVAVCAKAADDGTAFVETDMRAHMNPTRMQSLRPLADRLAQRLAHLCPDCHAPGYGRVDVVQGLPCSDCGAPTAWTHLDVYGCMGCGMREHRPRADGLLTIEPVNCPACNP
ncbi:MAG: hypothetical protein DCF16_18595 [Alphaproteobacteria bacterium]|nr:MAG: hypothetical protein DCF16_18595 [Alphaproteobacteria bacterium]